MQVKPFKVCSCSWTSMMLARRVSTPGKHQMCLTPVALPAVPSTCRHFPELPWTEDLLGLQHCAAEALRSYVHAYAERFHLLPHIRWVLSALGSLPHDQCMGEVSMPEHLLQYPDPLVPAPQAPVSPRGTRRVTTGPTCCAPVPAALCSHGGEHYPTACATERLHARILTPACHVMSARTCCTPCSFCLGCMEYPMFWFPSSYVPPSQHTHVHTCPS